MKRQLLFIVTICIALLCGLIGGDRSSPLAAQAQAPAEAKATSPEKGIDLSPPTAGEKAILDALEKPIDIAAVEEPLTDVMKDLATKLKINIDVDEKGLKDIGIDPRSPVTLGLKGVKLRNVLRLMLKEMDLTYVVRDEVLLIATPEEASGRLVTRVYDVRGLTADPSRPGEPADVKGLIDVVANSVAPVTWDRVGGPANISFAKDSLVIEQTEEAHEEIALLLSALRKGRASYDQWNGRDRPIPDLPPGESWLALASPAPEWQANLAKPVTLSFDKTPLDEAVAALKDLTKIPFLLDTKGLKDVGLDEKTPVTIECRNLSLNKALRQMLRDHDMTYKIRDGVLLVTTAEETDCSIWTAVFPVFDLATPPILADLAAEPRDAPMTADQLIARIKAHGTLWEGVGGPGVIQYHAATGSLIAHNLRPELEHVGLLLAALRKTSPVVAKPDGALLQRELITVRHGPFTVNVVDHAPAAAPAPFGENAVCQPVMSAEKVDTAKLAEAIRAFIEPKSWNLEDGPKIIAFPDRLLIRQTRPMHARIARFIRETLDTKPTANLNGKQSSKASQEKKYVHAPKPQPAMPAGAFTPVAKEDAKEEPAKPAEPVPPTLEKERRIDAILQQLEKRIDLNADKTPLQDVVDLLSRRANTPIMIDEPALFDAHLDPELRVTRRLKGARIRSILAWLEYDHQLAWTIRGDVVLITTPEEANAQLHTRTYPVGDLMNPRPEQTARPIVIGLGNFTGNYPTSNSLPNPADDLIDLITATIDPVTWDTVGGPCGILAVGDSLVVSQRFAVHEKIATLLEHLRRSQRSRTKWTGQDHSLPDLPADRAFHAVDPLEAKWEKIRRQKVTLDFQAASLPEIARELSQKSGLPFVIAFDDPSVAKLFADGKVTFSCDDLPWESALDRLLHRRELFETQRKELTWKFFHESILITIDEDGWNDLPTWVFPVYDFITEPLPYDLQRARPKELDPDDIVDAITASIEPTTWDTVGGPNSCAYFPAAHALVVSAPREIQLEVAALLEKLRRDLPVAPKRDRAEMETMLVTRMYGPFRDEAPPAPKPAPAPAPPAPAPKAGNDDAKNGQGFFGGLPAGFAPPPPVRIRADEVAQAIRLLVEPETWEKPESGARIILLTDRVIVRHQVRVHDKIAHVIEGLVK